MLAQGHLQPGASGTERIQSLSETLKPARERYTDRVTSVEWSNYKPDSPCTGICRMDEKSGLCTGCLRTIAEITSWWTLSVPERKEVYALIERRRKDLARTAG